MSDPKKKKTLIVGATTNPGRYAYLSAKMFAEREMEFIPIGIKKGEVFGQEILDLRSKPILEDIHTITLSYTIFDVTEMAGGVVASR